MSLPGDLVLLGRVHGHRGARGEMTIRVYGGPAEDWVGLEEIVLGAPGVEHKLEVEESRAYRDRLVVKPRGIDDASGVAAWKGRQVLVSRTALPDLEPGRFLGAALIGLRVETELGECLGVVEAVQPTGGTDLLHVRSAVREGKQPQNDEPLLIPLTPDIVVEVDEPSRKVRVRLPEGLQELNRD